MNDFDAWQKMLSEWQQVNRMKRLNQQLYDQLGGTIIYILNYSEKNNIPLPNRDNLYRMIDNIHDITGPIKQLHREINTASDDRIQPTKNNPSDEEEYRTQNNKPMVEPKPIINKNSLDQ